MHVIVVASGPSLGHKKNKIATVRGIGQGPLDEAMAPRGAGVPGFAEQIVGGPWPHPSRAQDENVCFSGACTGADLRFATAALASAHRVVHFLGPRNAPCDEAAATQADCLCHVPDSLLDGPVITRAVARAALARCGGRAGDASEAHASEAHTAALDEWRDSRRNFLQVRRSEV